MKSVHLVIFAFLFSVVGCAPVQYSTVPQQKPTIQHQYEFSVVDVDGSPLEGVNIEYTIRDRGSVIENSSNTTSSDGILSRGLNATMDPDYSYLKRYKSRFDFIAKKDGYYSKSGTMSSTYGEEYSHSKPVEKNKSP